MPVNLVEQEDPDPDGNAHNHADKDSKVQGLHLPSAHVLRVMRKKQL